MSDPTNPDHDDRLRAALNAEADDVTAGRDLMDRIHRAAERGPSRSGRRLPWLLAAGAAATIAGLVATIALRDDDQTVDVVDDPTTTTTGGPTTTTTPVSSSTTEADGVDGRPTLVALVRFDGWLVTVDLKTGEEHELLSFGDPREETAGEEEPPDFIHDVDLSADGEWIYFSTCCDITSATTYRVPVDGGPEAEVAMGRNPQVSPDGRFIATTVNFGLITVTPAPGVPGEPVTFQAAYSVVTGSDPDMIAGEPERFSWSPDGTQLGFVANVSTGDITTEVRDIHALRWDGSALSIVDLGKPITEGSFVSWTPDGTIVASSGSVDDDRGLSQDRSYRWLLWVDEANVIRQQEGFESGTRDPIPGLPKAFAADW